MVHLRSVLGSFLTVSALFIPAAVFAQSQHMLHEWTTTFPRQTGGRSVATDPSGSVCIAGQFADTLQLGGATHIAISSLDLFLAKYATDGSYLWSASYGGSGGHECIEIATDNAANIILMGRSTGSVDFGGGPLVGQGIVLAKVAPDGTHIWSRLLPDVDAKGLATDSAGNVVIIGGYSGSADFGGGALTPAVGQRAFVVKFDSDGVHQWSQSYGRDGVATYGYGIAVDPFGDVLMTGACMGVDFGGGPLGGSCCNSLFVVKLDTNGHHVWSRSTLEGSQYSYGLEVVTDRDGSVFISGTLTGVMYLEGVDPLGNEEEAPAFYLAQLGRNGSVTSAENVGIMPNYGSEPTPGWYGWSQLAVDGHGNVYVTGMTTSLIGAGSPAIWWWTHGHTGVFGRNGGATYCYDLAADTIGNVFMMGEFCIETDFGGGVLASSWPGGDGYVVKLAQVDTDADNIANPIDLEPIDFSNEFSDVALGGTTSGYIVFRGPDFAPHQITIEDEPAPLGVRISTVPNLDPRTSSFSVCGAGFELDPPETMVLTCSSVQATAIAGPIDAFLGPAVTAQIHSGATLKMHALGGGQSEIASLPESTAPVVVSVGGVATELGAGESLTASIPEGPPICQVTPNSVDFGSTTPGVMVARPLVIRNIGASILSGSLSETCAEFSVDSTDAYHLAAGESLVATVRFSPTSVGQYACTVQTGAGGACANIVLRGFAGGTVPVVIQSFASCWAGDHVELTWMVADLGLPTSFEVQRKEEPNGIYAELGPVDSESLGGTVTVRDYSALRGRDYRYRVVIWRAGEAIGTFETSTTTPALKLALRPAQPNPFNPTTSVSFDVDLDAHVSLAIYDIAGSRVRTILDRRMLSGSYTERWDGRDEHGKPVASGVYVCRLMVGARTLSQKAVLLR